MRILEKLGIKFGRNKSKQSKTMDKIEFINGFTNDFISMLKSRLEEKGLEVNEFDDDLEEKITEFFNKKTLSEANKYLYKLLDTFVKNTYHEIDWSLDKKAVKETKAYKDWERHCDISTIWGDCSRMLNSSYAWVEINGKAHTEEEAAKIAADKWCEILFDWHFQDNGASNEDHGGGFYACTFATVLSNVSKKDITDEMKENAHKLFNEYYTRQMHYRRTFDRNDIEWLKKTLSSKDGNFKWASGFDYDISCDYDPSWPLFLILENAGIPEDVIRSISPWKTSISIRKEDNMVFYCTYQNVEEL